MFMSTFMFTFDELKKIMKNEINITANVKMTM